MNNTNTINAAKPDEKAMGGIFKTLKQSPLSAQWRFVASRSGWTYYKNGYGKLYRTDGQVWQHFSA